MTLELAKIVQAGKQFQLEAGKEIPMDKRVARSPEELVGRLVSNFHNLPDGTILDVEMPDHQHITLGSAREEKGVPVLAAS